MLQASSREASSVNVRTPSGAKRAYASRSRDLRTPCGVCAAPTPVRSMVSPTRSPAIRLSVSATGTIGMAAPWRAVASATAAMRSAATRGRAASCTRITPASSASAPSRAANPAWTDSWRRSPPATTAITDRGSQSAAATNYMMAPSMRAVPRPRVTS